MNSLQKQSDCLLKQIKNNLSEIKSLHDIFTRLEEDYVYLLSRKLQSVRCSHTNKDARKLFEKIAPDGICLNDWYWNLADKAISKNFEGEKTNSKWLGETRPILEAYFHSKYFLQQMLVSGKQFEVSPQLLPSGWAAVLYLYNLR